MIPERTSLYTLRPRAGFSLGELLVAILCLAVLMLPLLAYVTGIAGLGNRVAEESGARAWSCLQGAAVVEGVDSSSAAVLARGRNPAVSFRPRKPVSLAPGEAVVGRVAVGRLHLQGVGEHFGNMGFHLEPGLRSPEPEVPAQPLSPRTMLPPVISPAPGSVVSIASLMGTGRLSIQARSTEGGRVLLRIGLSGPLQTGSENVTSEAPAGLLAVGLCGQAWVEFDGDLVPGALRVALADGRTEWRVPESGGERLVSPSDFVTVNYILGLGSPVLLLGGAEYSAGARVPVDYQVVSSVQEGRAPFVVDWPASVRALLGGAAPQCMLGFTTQFQGESGPLDGNLAGFTSASGLALWASMSRVEASPVLAGACRGEPGVWSLARDLLSLPPPELVSPVSGPLASGALGFRAAEFGDIGRIGRLSARGGLVLSSGNSLELEVLP